MRGASQLAIAALATGLSACGVVDTPHEFCNAGFSLHPAFAGPDIALCPGCSVSDSKAAIDGKGGTATVFTFDPVGGQAIYQAITTGHAFSAGSMAGAYMRFPVASTGGYVNPSITVTTYDGGELQDSFQYDGTVYGTIEGAGTDYFYGGETTHRFGEVRVTVTMSGALSDNEVRVYELCGDY